MHTNCVELQSWQKSKMYTYVLRTWWRHTRWLSWRGCRSIRWFLVKTGAFRTGGYWSIKRALTMHTTRIFTSSSTLALIFISAHMDITVIVKKATKHNNCIQGSSTTSPIVHTRLFMLRKIIEKKMHVYIKCKLKTENIQFSMQKLKRSSD